MVGYPDIPRTKEFMKFHPGTTAYCRVQEACYGEIGLCELSMDRKNNWCEHLNRNQVGIVRARDNDGTFKGFACYGCDYK